MIKLNFVKCIQQQDRLTSILKPTLPTGLVQSCTRVQVLGHEEAGSARKPVSWSWLGRQTILEPLFGWISNLPKNINMCLINISINILYLQGTKKYKNTFGPRKKLTLNIKTNEVLVSGDSLHHSRRTGVGVARQLKVHKASSLTLLNDFTQSLHGTVGAAFLPHGRQHTTEAKELKKLWNNLT